MANCQAKPSGAGGRAEGTKRLGWKDCGRSGGTIELLGGCGGSDIRGLLDG